MSATMGSGCMSTHSLERPSVSAGAALGITRAQVDFDDAERALGKYLSHQRQRHVVHGDVLRREAFRTAMMGVTVEDCGHRVPAEGLFEATAAKEREDF